jgi:hypothetical protein
MEVDHINCNRIDNRKSNLRHATRSQNVRNTIPRTDTSSKFKGVHWHKASKKWMTRIYINGKRKFIGSFNNEYDAALAYNAAAAEHYGEFARLNHIPSWQEKGE